MESDWIWLSNLAIIWLGYSYILVPIATIVFYTKWRQKTRKLGAGRVDKLLKSFAIGYQRQQELSSLEDAIYEENHEFKRDCFWLAYYSSGLIGTLWIMGLVQERIITQPYPDLNEKMDRFTDMQFLIFCNRLAALLFALCEHLFNRRRQPLHTPPYYYHSFTSIANIMSSWFQYTALKFVSFPIMTMSKTGKTVAIMLMGTLLRGQRYSYMEYAAAGGIAIGASLFIVNSSNQNKFISSTTISGMVLILGYIVFDSFTSNWQKALFEKPKISRNQMMLGANYFSVMILSVASLAEQNGLLANIEFTLNHKYLLQHIIWMSFASAVSQIFIYGLIDNYGPTTFSLVLTFRQIGSILLSILFYGHLLPHLSVLGLCIAFFSVFLLIYFRYSKKNVYKTGPEGFAPWKGDQ